MKLNGISLNLSHLLNDKAYIKRMYYKIFGQRINLDNPKTLSEKIQWLKLNDHNPKYTRMVDKFEAKEYVKELIGQEYIVPTIGIYNNFNEINFNDLPNQFVMKCTHDSGSVFVCKDKAKIDINKLQRYFESKLKRNFYWDGREWPYKDVKPRIIIEKYMKNKSQIIEIIRTILKDNNIDDNEPTNNIIQIYQDDIENSEHQIDIKNIKKQIEEKLILENENYYFINNNILFCEFSSYNCSESIIKEALERYNDFSIQHVADGVVLSKNNLYLFFHKENEYLADYKFYVFNGKAKFLYVGDAEIRNGKRTGNDLLTHLNLDYSIAEFQRTDHRILEQIPKKPLCFEKMIELANKLAENIPFVRVDLFCIDNKPYFSEFTFSPGSGFISFYPEKYNKIFGDYIEIWK